jgi:hypothetical protein
MKHLYSATNTYCYGQSAYNIWASCLRTDSRAAANKGFAIAGVTCFADTFVQSGSSALRMKFSAKTLRHRKPPNRCM